MNTSFSWHREERKRENEFIAHYHKFALATVTAANGAEEGGAAKTHKKKLHNATLIALAATDYVHRWQDMISDQMDLIRRSLVA